MVIHAFVTSRLDYWNSLYIDVPQSCVIVCSWFRMQRLGSFVGSLSHQFWSHCPSCQSNIEMLLFVYKSLHNQSPLYLCDLLHPHTQSRSLRSADTGLLQVPRARLKNRDDDDQWIPVHIRSALTLSICNSTLKTYLFSMAFSIPWFAVQWLSVLVNLRLFCSAWYNLVHHFYLHSLCSTLVAFSCFQKC